MFVFSSPILLPYNVWCINNIAHIFRGVKGRRETLTTPTKRKPEGEVGGAVSSLLGIFENKLHSKSISERIYASPAKRQRGDL